DGGAARRAAAPRPLPAARARDVPVYGGLPPRPALARPDPRDRRRRRGLLLLRVRTGGDGVGEARRESRGTRAVAPLHGIGPRRDAHPRGAEGALPRRGLRVTVRNAAERGG